MIRTFFQKKKRLPLFLVPRVRKRHVLPIYKDHETQWKLFAEGALRNQVFHDEVMHRGNKCLACDQLLTTGKTKYPHIEKHHHCYLRLCAGNILPDDSSDIYREVRNAEFPHVPDCRQCKVNNPEYFEGCIKKIFPVHGKCHGHIHEVERYRFDKLAEKLQRDFAYPGSGTNECV
ncbi:hypothetical protein [Nitrosomonas sp.]|uniref:hypothetical protein n=1 Tax=Nitrosomonas sp. TaxID=42353 RepID=UPI001D62CD58|nr:hypothetical protein [Nitrosomonas sp.]MBX3617107.1 hypothetical protein [Nitrosomonas sp.]